MELTQKSLPLIQGLGTDIIEIQRVREVINRFGDRFLNRLFTKNEQSYCLRRKDSATHFAGRFAAKESVVKALGTGIKGSVGWTDIEILNNLEGEPEVFLSTQLQQTFAAPIKIQLSISHCRQYAMAVSIIS